MKILLDECLPVDLRHYFGGHEVHSVSWAGMRGLKNGHLLRKAEESAYDVLLTLDQGLPYQQDLAGRTVAVMVVLSPTNQLKDLLPLVRVIEESLQKVVPGQVFFIGP